jgi:hypothetical protein
MIDQGKITPVVFNKIGVGEEQLFFAGKTSKNSDKQI